MMKKKKKNNSPKLNLSNSLMTILLGILLSFRTIDKIICKATIINTTIIVLINPDFSIKLPKNSGNIIDTMFFQAL